MTITPPKTLTEPMRRESFRLPQSEREAANVEAIRRGMTFSQLVRLAVKNEVKKGEK